MQIDPIFVQWALGIIGVVAVAGIGFILRTLNQQTQALAVLVARVDPTISNAAVLQAAVTDHNSRLAGLEADMSRIWGIYDGYKTTVGTHNNV
jgi:hypothetical protein